MQHNFSPAQRARLFLGTLVVLACGVSAPAALAAPDLKWDLSYRSALREHPIADNEFMAIWPDRYPKRPIHDKLANYAGERIEASLLIERPDGDSGYPFASWFIKTRTTAQVCSLYKDPERPCKQLDPARTEAFISEVMNFKPLKFTPSKENEIGNVDGTPILANYVGFISVYVNGRALQRPIAGVEGERLSDAIAKVQLTPQELKEREAQIEQQRRATAFIEAVRMGDIDTMRRLVDQGQQIEDPRNHEFPAIAIAAGAGQKAAVSFLLQRGARIDATESAALKAAVEARDSDMVEYLLSRGAKVDPPRHSLSFHGGVHATPLGVAVKLKDMKMAQLLIRRGANVNAAQYTPPLTSATLARDLPMMDLLISHGAKPDQSGNYDSDTALMQLAQSSGTLTRPIQEAQQNASLKAEAELKNIVMKLVAAGANVNHVTSTCGTAYAKAKLYESEGMVRLLTQLGADPQLGTRCVDKKNAINSYGKENPERKATADIAGKIRNYLTAEDYRGLEALYKKLNKETERTPSGLWELATFVPEFKNFTRQTTNAQYWDAIDAQINKWERQVPKSVLVKIFQAYALRQRAMAHRGDGPGASVSEENVAAMTKYADKAYMLLLPFEPQAALHPEWCRAMLDLLPYIPNRWYSFEARAQQCIRLHPGYHELYFTAAFYLEPRWGGSFAKIDALAKNAAAATSAKEGRALYSRIYWYLDQSYYSGSRSSQPNATLFTKTAVNWTEMRAGFDDMVARYPDPWNLNAYAYFACKAQDFKTMNQVLEQIGDRLLYPVWPGSDTLEECLRHQDTDKTVLR